MQLLRPNDYQTMPWKNGGGITHEVALANGPNGFAWRLSIADVATSGPFSMFEGKERILTVIEGAGIELVSRDNALKAFLKQPTKFSGETEIDGKLVDGPIRDFNLIFDPLVVSAEVRIAQTDPLKIHAGVTALAVFAVIGETTCGDIRLGTQETAIFEGSELPDFVSSESWAIVVEIFAI